MSAAAHVYIERQKFLVDDGAANDFSSYSLALFENTSVIGAFRVDETRGR